MEIFPPSSCYVVFELFVSKYLSGVSVTSWKLSTLSTTNKPLNLFNLLSGQSSSTIERLLT